MKQQSGAFVLEKSGRGKGTRPRQPLVAKEQGTGRVKITTEGVRVLRDLDHR